MQNRIVITKYNNQYIALFIKNGIAIKIRCFESIKEFYGQVYFGRIKTVKNNISASFVNYNGDVGYIPSDKRKPETVFPVMVKKLTAKNKENELTDKITITGLYTVVGDNINDVNFSKKLSKEFRDSFNKGNFTNVIIRNNAQNTDYNSVQNEYKFLLDIYNHIQFIKDKRTDNSILYNGIPKIINTIFSENISEYDEIITDEEDAFEILNSFIELYKANSISININLKKYHDDLVPLNALISLAAIMERATSKKVYLKSDAYLVFDYTEAMNVIDVNSGTTRFKGDKSDVIHKINLEAAKEIALQLKLRNLAGITIVDFINNKSESFNNELIMFLKNELQNDDCHAKCHGMTNLGLVEITRERIEKPLREQLWK